MFQFQVKIVGESPGIIHHDARGLDTTLPLKIEEAHINAKRGADKTTADLERLKSIQCELSLWLKTDGRTPTIPTRAIRSCIEGGAKKLKQGGNVRGGLIVLESEFTYDVNRYGATIDELINTTQLTVKVNVNRSSVLRTRALFAPPWECTFKVEYDDELVDAGKLERWLDIAGRRIGIGDWRPDKSGEYGRFRTESIEEVEDDAPMHEQPALV